jgi:hypothetical protein
LTDARVDHADTQVTDRRSEQKSEEEEDRKGSTRGLGETQKQEDAAAAAASAVTSAAKGTAGGGIGIKSEREVGDIVGKRRRAGERPHKRFSTNNKQSSPTKWLRCWHESGHPYFVDALTGQSEWILPEGDTYEDAPTDCVEPAALLPAAAQNEIIRACTHGDQTGMPSEESVRRASMCDPGVSNMAPAGRPAGAAPQGSVAGVGGLGGGACASGGAGGSGGGEASVNTATEVQQSAICHVCQRKFKSTELLVKHCSMSQLHRQKVAEAKARELADIKAEMGLASLSDLQLLETDEWRRQVLNLPAY